MQASVNEKVQPLAKDLIDGDLIALERQVPDAAAIVSAVTGDVVAETEGIQFRSHVIGSAERWLEVNFRDPQAGSFFDEGQVRTTARVAVLAPTTASTLFGGASNALGQIVRINHQSFKVIGVLQVFGEPTAPC